MEGGKLQGDMSLPRGVLVPGGHRVLGLAGRELYPAQAGDLARAGEPGLQGGGKGSQRGRP